MTHENHNYQFYGGNDYEDDDYCAPEFFFFQIIIEQVKSWLFKSLNVVSLIPLTEQEN